MDLFNIKCKKHCTDIQKSASTYFHCGPHIQHYANKQRIWGRYWEGSITVKFTWSQMSNMRVECRVLTIGGVPSTTKHNTQHTVICNRQHITHRTISTDCIQYIYILHR